MKCECVRCGIALPRRDGPGRPRLYCDSCRIAVQSERLYPTRTSNSAERIMRECAVIKRDRHGVQLEIIKTREGHLINRGHVPGGGGRKMWNVGGGLP